MSLPDTAPGGRDGAAVEPVGSKTFFLGGVNEQFYFQDMWALFVGTDQMCSYYC